MTEDSFYEELEQVFDHFPKYYILSEKSTTYVALLLNTKIKIMFKS
jgi:hypothetical protein